MKMWFIQLASYGNGIVFYAAWIPSNLFNREPVLLMLLICLEFSQTTI